MKIKMLGLVLLLGTSGSAFAAQRAEQVEPPVGYSSSKGVKRPVQTVRKPILAIKTDLVQWLAVAPGFKIGTWTPNLEVEGFVAPSWSVGADGSWAKWPGFFRGNDLDAVWSANAYGRYWPLAEGVHHTGLFVSAIAHMGDFDTQKGSVGRTGSFYGGGVGVGYMLPVAGVFGFEFELRGLYRLSLASVYDIEPGGNYLNHTERSGEFVPQIKVNLVFRIGK